jgi:threonine/homoserine/homoserine lactone efflux protein
MKSKAGFFLPLGASLVAIAVPVFGGVCAVITPEPSTFLLIGGGGAAILIWRHLRSKKK